MSVEQNESTLAVIWHDLECGGYSADLGRWRALAAEKGDPVLDVGAGTGRTALALARERHCVTALDEDPVLIAELTLRVGALPITTVVADAREMALDRQFSLIIVPMQTIQLLGGQDGRHRFLSRAVRHLRQDGLVAAAITDELERFSLEDGTALPTPDMTEIDGIVYSSQPTAVREDPQGFVLERLRERITADGRRLVEQNVIRLDRLSAAQLEREGEHAGLQPLGRELIGPTADHVGSVVVKLGG